MTDNTRRRHLWFTIVLIALAVLAGGWLCLERAGIHPWLLLTAGKALPLAPESRPAAWAQPIQRPGLPNLHQVSPDLYRGAQPEADGPRELEKLGIHTVVNLRTFHADPDEAAATGPAHERIHMKAWHAEDEDVVRFLKIVTDPARTPVFVHCLHGSDRTGTMCAVYRIVVQGWPREDAIREMTEGGFGFHEAWGNLPDYLRTLDVQRIRQLAGMTPSP
jgi:protein tyrosine phosphatase (PTP) superfamily phosphohydrolase (DUF442 family)